MKAVKKVSKTEKAKLRSVLEVALRNDVKESDGAHWEYPENELQSLLNALVPTVIKYLESC